MLVMVEDAGPPGGDHAPRGCGEQPGCGRVPRVPPCQETHGTVVRL